MSAARRGSLAGDLYPGSTQVRQLGL